MKERKKRSKVSIILNILLAIITIFVISKLWHEYEMNEFYDFVKAEYHTGISKFSKDDIIKCSNKNSYKIESEEFNDALIYKTIDVEQDTVYRITAMVRFENVENEKEKSEGGVNIGIMDTTEKSESLIGSGDWQKISFEFDSKNRDKVDIVFRLGSYDDNSKGKAWFSDFTIEKGKKKTEKNWNFICFIMKNLEAEFEEDGKLKVAKTSLKTEEITYIEDNMKRFQTSMKELSRRTDDSII